MTIYCTIQKYNKCSKFTALNTIAQFSLNWVLNANMSLFGTFLLQTHRRQAFTDIARLSHMYYNP